MAGEKIGKRSEKTQFSVTCRLLSQYLKEKGSFGSIGLELAPWPIHHQPQEKHQAPTTLSLLPGVDVSTEDQTINNTDQNAPKSMELFPQHAGIDSESVRIPSNIKTEKPQLTIFYCGKVLVFDDFPADKAEDLLQMASKESIAAQKIAFTAPSSSTGADCSSQQETAHANASDMPIARKKLSSSVPHEEEGSDQHQSSVSSPWWHGGARLGQAGALPILAWVGWTSCETRKL